VSTWGERRAAIRAAYAAAPPVPAARVDLTDLGGAAFTPPAIPALTAAMSTAARHAALAGAVWIRLQIVGAPGSRPLHLGSWSPTVMRGAVNQAIFYPAGFGQQFVESIVAAAQALFHRVDLLGGEIRFRDAEEPVDAEQPEGSKFAQIHVVNPFTVYAAVEAT